MGHIAMKTKLWQTDGALHPLVESYTVGADYIHDQQLLGYDIQATKAHVAMLAAVKLITAKECKQLVAALDDLHGLWQKGRFTVTHEHEDGHTAIELYLTETLGAVGKKVHTGRSRNDQALVMMRLYMKDNLMQVSQLLNEVSAAYKAAALAAGNTPMPGYTHTQKAMPTTVAMWLDSFACGFDDAQQLIGSTASILDQNPLGSAAGFGVSLPLNRDMTTQLLGFEKTQQNPMYCGLSRGFFELLAVQSLQATMLLAGKFAQDMLLFTSQEFNFFSLPQQYTTGSSIMPHKRNYDVFEIMRGRAHGFMMHTAQLQTVAGGVGSGYHRDLQLTKQTTLAAFDSTKQTLEVLKLVVPAMTSNTSQLQAAMTDELRSVEQINLLVTQGVPFRDAYRQVKKTLL